MKYWLNYSENFLNKKDPVSAFCRFASKNFTKGSSTKFDYHNGVYGDYRIRAYGFDSKESLRKITSKLTNQKSLKSLGLEKFTFRHVINEKNLTYIIEKTN